MLRKLLKYIVQYNCLFKKGLHDNKQPHSFRSKLLNHHQEKIQLVERDVGKKKQVALHFRAHKMRVKALISLNELRFKEKNLSSFALYLNLNDKKCATCR